MQRKLWEDEGTLDLHDASITIHREYFPASKADTYLQELRKIRWKQKKIVVFGKKHLEPRETAWYGDGGISYTYSGVTHTARPWIPVLAEMREDIMNTIHASFNSVLLNRYRDGQDGVAWHADDELELGDHPIIASVSLGQTRCFQIRRKQTPKEVVSLNLHHGDLVVMSGDTQKFWEHQVPKTKQKVAERINLTFRKIHHG